MKLAFVSRQHFFLYLNNYFYYAIHIIMIRQQKMYILYKSVFMLSLFKHSKIVITIDMTRTLHVFRS